MGKDFDVPSNSVLALRKRSFIACMALSSINKVLFLLAAINAIATCSDRAVRDSFSCMKCMQSSTAKRSPFLAYASRIGLNVRRRRSSLRSMRFSISSLALATNKGVNRALK